VRVAETVAKEWTNDGECGLVVGATYPDELRVVRETVGDLPILVPGVGVQGGDPSAAVQVGTTPDGRGLIVSSSRAILYAGSGEDFADAARTAALALREALRLPP
jgi:orotidine-5'-phosphate decarboxylase